jgi:hypothetical protein
MSFRDTDNNPPNPHITMPIASNMIADLKISDSTHAHPLDPLSAGVSNE